MDSHRQGRMGTITSEDDSVVMLVNAYVKTEDTEEMGAYDPIESFSRPFPYLVGTSGKTVYVENFIQGSKLEPLSETVIEYTSHLYDSIMNEEWSDELESYDDNMFDSVGQDIAAGLLSFSMGKRPHKLWDMVYESSKRHVGGEYDSSSPLNMNPLRDISGRERYDFDYLPSVDDVDSWGFRYYHTDVVNEHDIRVHTESLWVQYTIGNTTEERPIIIMKNSESNCLALSPNVSYGDEEDSDVPKGLIKAILEEDMSYDSTLVTDSISELNNTKTMEFLQNY